MLSTMYAYETRRRKDKRGGDLLSDALLLGRLWYGEPMLSRMQSATRCPAAVHMQRLN